jgi:hypothetical protein
LSDRVNDVHRGIVPRSIERLPRLALVESVDAATNDEPFAVVLCSGIGLHSREVRNG